MSRDAAWQQLGELLLAARAERPSLLARLLRRRDPRLEAIDGLGRFGSHHGVFTLVGLIREGGGVGRRAGRSLGAIAERLTPARLAWIDETLRVGGQWADYFGGPPRPRELAAVARRHRAVPAVIGLYASHPNGFVREEAVKALGSVSDGSELRFLALRVNDWVDPVAARAKSLLLERVVAANRSAVCRELPFLAGIAERSRRDHRELIEAIGAVLRSDGGRELVSATSLDRRTRRLAFQWLFATPLPADAPAVDAALADTDPVIQIAAVRAVAKGGDGAALSRALGTISQASPLVRVEALKLEAPARVRESLFDASQLVRRRARGLARELDLALDPSDLLRAALHGGNPLALTGAVELLGERGASEHAASLVPLVTHPKAEVRMAALGALARLAPREQTHALAQLTDPVRRVRSLALAILRRESGNVDYPPIFAVTRASADPSIRGDSIALLARASKWQALDMLLECLSDRDEGVRRRAAEQLDRWCARFNRSFAQPTASQRASIARSRVAFARLIPPKLDELLRETLGPS